MLSIGFTTEYYTLWNVTSEIRWDNSGDCPMPYQNTQYTYLQNLSIDKDKAIAKAKEMGVVNLEPDTDLYGRNGSWNFEKKLFSQLPNNINPFFEFGKYFGSKIIECTDINYLNWYYDQTYNRYAKQVLLSNGYKEHSLQLFTSEEYEKLQERILKQSIAQGILNEFEEQGVGIYTFTPTRNLSESGFIEVNGLTVYFPEHKEMYYNGFSYALPTINGVGKKIKGLEVVCSIKVTEHPHRDDNKVLQVISFKINK